MTPDWRIRAEGSDITDVVRDRLVSLRIEDGIGVVSDTCELALDDRGAAIVPPEQGAVLEVELGWRGGGLAPMGRWVVDARELSGPPRTLTVRGTGPDLLGGLKAPRTRAWDYVSLGDLVGAIAGANGLRPQVHGALSGLVLPHIDQVDESDLAVLRRLARQLDAVARPAGGALVVTPRQALGEGRAPVATVRRVDAAEYQLLEGRRDAYGSVQAQWRSAPRATPMTVLAGAGEPVYSLPGMYPDEAAAMNAAEARLRELQRGTSTLTIALAAGLPALAAELPVTLEEFGAPIDADRWVAVHTEHVLTDAGGYITKATLERPTDPWPRASSTLP